VEQVPIRQLQQHASAVIRRVRHGETVGITDRGRLVAVLSPPPPLEGAAALIAAGRVRPGSPSISEVLEDLRADRV
jgi:prevent-host-death family protein